MSKSTSGGRRWLGWLVIVAAGLPLLLVFFEWLNGFLPASF